MTIPRSKQIDVNVTRWYHCTSRCVRKAFLLSDRQETQGRRLWLEQRLQELEHIFAISVAGYAIMENHLHVLLRLDPDVASCWNEHEIVERWFMLYPPKRKDRGPLTPKEYQTLVGERLNDPDWIAERRARLQSISWFMKCLKEPLARIANRADGCTGAFFEGRFKSIAILDQEALLATCAYIDLNPVAARSADTPESSLHTSISSRVQNVQKHGRIEDLRKSHHGSITGSNAAQDLEETLWLIPVEDRRRIDSEREGMLAGFTLGNYLQLVEHTGRMWRAGKTAISRELGTILDRLGTSADFWTESLLKIKNRRLKGRVFSACREKLRDAAQSLGVSHLKNRSAVTASL